MFLILDCWNFSCFWEVAPPGVAQSHCTKMWSETEVEKIFFHSRHFDHMREVSYEGFLPERLLYHVLNIVKGCIFSPNYDLFLNVTKYFSCVTLNLTKLWLKK